MDFIESWNQETFDAKLKRLIGRVVHTQSSPLAYKNSDQD